MIGNKKIKEKTFYCYEAKLKYKNKDEICVGIIPKPSNLIITID